MPRYFRLEVLEKMTTICKGCTAQMQITQDR